MKVFISQPMKDISREDIINERNKIIDFINDYSYVADKIEIIDSVQNIQDDPQTPLWYLGKSLELLSTADLCIFAKGYENYRGCRIEKLCCEEYGIDYIEMEY